MKRIYSFLGWSIFCFFTLVVSGSEVAKFGIKKDVVDSSKGLEYYQNWPFSQFDKRNDIDANSINERLLNKIELLYKESPNQSFVEEYSAPIPESIELPVLFSECNVIATPPRASNHLGARILASTDDPIVYSKQGTYSINWKYEDENGNVTVQTQQVIIDDVSALKPDLMKLPVLRGDCQVIAPTPAAFDNCIGTVFANTSDPLIYSETGQHSILWVYKDGNGNETYQEQTVIVEDTVSPEIVAPDDIEFKIKEGEAFAVDINLGEAIATDNCNKARVSNNAPDSYPIGETQVIWEAVDESGNKSYATQKVHVSIESIQARNTANRFSFDQEIETGDFALYPNPASQMTNIFVPLDQKATVKIEVFDVAGRSVFTTHVKKSSSFNYEIPVEELSSGVYMVSVEIGNLVKSKRLIKK